MIGPVRSVRQNCWLRTVHLLRSLYRWLCCDVVIRQAKPCWHSSLKEKWESCPGGFPELSVLGTIESRLAAAVHRSSHKFLCVANFSFRRRRPSQHCLFIAAPIRNGAMSS